MGQEVVLSYFVGVLENSNDPCFEQVVELFDQYRSFYGCKSDQGLARFFLVERLLLNESILLVAKKGESVIGFAQLYLGFTSIGCARVFILNDLFVLEANRGCGVGKKLIDSVVKKAEDAGVAMVTLETAKDNFSARSLYESYGFQCAEKFDSYFLPLKKY